MSQVRLSRFMNLHTYFQPNLEPKKKKKKKYIYIYIYIHTQPINF